MVRVLVATRISNKTRTFHRALFERKDNLTTGETQEGCITIGLYSFPPEIIRKPMVF